LSGEGLLSGEDPVPLAPQPGLAQLAALVATVRAAGQPVRVRVPDAELSHGVDLAAYRVVQESLTNALRYAPGADTEVRIELGDDTLLVEVSNGPGPAGAPRSTHGGSGAGLLGLAERLRLYDGTLEAGRRLGGGFRVRARIPLALP
jgi:signal transduction histidine kinase